MNRTLHLLSACLVFSVVACGDDVEDTVKISLFQGAPDAIEIGQTTKLVFAVDPPDAVVTITDVGDVSGKTQASVHPTATTTYHMTATKGKATATGDTTVSVGPQTTTAIKVEPASSTPTAGDSLTVTVTALSANGLAAPGFRGTIHFTSSDPAAVLPPDFTYAAGDAGVKQIKVTLKTAGIETLNAIDIADAVRRGSASVNVKPAAAANCTAGQAPATTQAGAVVGVAVVLHDVFGNVATGYTGTIRLSASDARAILPADATYTASDAGNRAFSAQLITSGAQTLTATDTVNAAITCTAQVSVTPGAPKLVLGLVSNNNAGFPVAVNVTVQDSFGNAITDYNRTVSFVSTDAGAGAVTPASIVFTGTEGGMASTSATFVSLGGQTLTATDDGAPAASASASTTCHGLVYTGPTQGRVRLVANPVSDTRVVQLDLVANERLEVSSFFGGGPGSFAAGVNLPLDTNRVGPDATLFATGNALVIQPAGNPPPPAILPVGAGVLNATDHTLYTAVSRRRVTGPVFNQETEVQAGRVFFSVRLQLTQNGTPGPVFDGAQPSPQFIAAVRDQFGDNFVSIGDFGIGRLAIQ